MVCLINLIIFTGCGKNESDHQPVTQPEKTESSVTQPAPDEKESQEKTEETVTEQEPDREQVENNEEETSDSLSQDTESAPTTEITLNDELREKLARHYERIFKPSGNFVCFEIDDETIENGYRTAIRYQMSDEEAEEVMANGGEVLPNRYAFTIEIDTSSGNVKMTEEDPFGNWSGGKDLSEYDWNLSED